MGAHMRFKKGNEIGSQTRFGPDWPGQRCGAKTRGGAPCKRAAVSGRPRCPLHGGKSTGPRTEAGRAKIAALHIKHGRLTKQERAEAKRRAVEGRRIRAELRDLEALAISQGWLDRDWRDGWK
jgi:hypothetical protein